MAGMRGPTSDAIPRRLVALVIALTLASASLGFIAATRSHARTWTHAPTTATLLAAQGSGTVADGTEALKPFHGYRVNPRMICGGNPGQCGNFQYFIPGSWWGYPWDHNNITYGYWNPSFSGSGAVVGCLVGTAAWALTIAAGGEVFYAGLVIGCVVGGGAGGAQLGVMGQ